MTRMLSTTEHPVRSRRAFLCGLGTLLCAAAIAPPVSTVWTQLTTEVPMGIDDLSMAYRRARRQGKPLLVTLYSGALQEALADLRHGGGEESRSIALLALCMSAKASCAEVASLLDLDQPSSGCELAFIETTGRRPTGTLFAPFLHIDLPDMPRLPGLFCGNSTPEEIQKFQKESAPIIAAWSKRMAPYEQARRRARARRLAGILASSIAPDLAALSRRARDARVALSEKQRVLVDQALTQNMVPPEPLCYQAAALVALAAAQAPTPAVKERFLDALTAAVLGSSDWG